VRNLVLEHFIHGFGLENLCFGGGTGAVVEKCGDYFCIFAGLGEKACAGGVEDFFFLGRCVFVEGPAEKVFACGEMSVWIASVHVC
jgi:hypothetical protein